MAGLLGNSGNVGGTETSGEQALVGITPGGVHDERSGILADGLGERLGSLLDDDVAPSELAGHRGVERRAFGISPVRELGDLDVGLEAGLSLQFVVRIRLHGAYRGTYHLPLDRAAVDSEIAQVAKKLLGTILGLDKFEEIWGIVDELGHDLVSTLPMFCRARTYSGPGLSGDEDVMSQQTEQEWNVGLRK